MIILGISCFFHDAAACLIKDGRLLAAASEERFSRLKHDSEFPIHAVEYCLREARILIDDVDYIAFYDKPVRKFDRILTTYLATYPKSFRAFSQALPVWTKRKLRIRELVARELYFEGPVIFGEHHLSHAASAFYVSPFNEAALLTIDGVGEWDTASLGVGRGLTVELTQELRYPHSLGLFYNAITYYLGFQVNSDEYKVMGLAPYGKSSFSQQMSELIDIRDDGSFRLNLDYFAFHYGLRMTNKRFDELFGGPRRIPESPITSRHCDIAASAQKIVEEVMVKLASYLHRETNLPNLCLAGGVALNCVANGRVLRETEFENIFVQPAADDAGGALGAALHLYHGLLQQPRSLVMEHASWGSHYENAEIQRFLKNEEIPFEVYDEHSLVERAASLLADGNVIGWYQGRMEFGPRALGNRSILADPRRADMKDRINRKIKFREDFRPFAPSILEERTSEYFELNCPSPFMLLVTKVRPEKREALPAITHVDGTARIQTVNQTQNARYYRLLKAFERQTGCPVLVNTSFNVRGEPIVCTPREALQCFMSTGLDYLVIGDCLVGKESGIPTDSGG